MPLVPDAIRLRFPESDSLLAWARWMLLAMAVVIPFSTALTNICFGLLLLFWLASGRFTEKLRVLRASKAAVMSGLIFLWIGAATVYSEAPQQQTVPYWLGYHKWLLIPLAITLVTDERWRLRILIAFAVSATLMLAASLAIAAYPLPFLSSAQLQERAQFATQNIYGMVRGDPTAQSLVFLVAAALVLHLATQLARPRSPAHFALRALAAIFLLDILYLSGGRTGFVLCLVVLPMLAWQLLPRRGALFAIVVLACAIPLVWMSSAHLRTRTVSVVEEVQRSDAGEHASMDNSTGLRLSFYRNGLALIRERPLFGYGAGSIETVYRQLLDRQANPADVATANLHNEYLNITVQFGLAGLLVFLAWITSHWICAQAMQMPWRPLAYVTIAAFAVGSLANSLFSSALEGHLYALIIGVLLAPGAPIDKDHVEAAT